MGGFFCFLGCRYLILLGVFLGKYICLWGFWCKWSCVFVCCLCNWDCVNEIVLFFWWFVFGWRYEKLWKLFGFCDIYWVCIYWKILNWFRKVDIFVVVVFIYWIFVLISCMDWVDGVLEWWIYCFCIWIFLVCM